MGTLAVGVAGLAAGLLVVFVLLRRHPGTPGAAELSLRMDAQAAEIRRLADAAVARLGAGDEIRREVGDARRILDLMRTRDEERRVFDEEGREVVRRLSTVLAGGASKGRAGEHVLRQHLAQLPPSMLATDFRVGGKVVEFGLVLPDGRRLPIDSKWPAVAELQALEGCTDPADREGLVREVERCVVGRAREVAQYIDPSVTAPVAIAAIPDAAYSVLKRAHADAFARGVVIVPYSSSLAVVLFLYSLVQRLGGEADVRSSLADVAGLLDHIESVLENKFARAATMLTNGADEVRSDLGKARGSIARAHALSPKGSDPEQRNGRADPGEGGPLALVN